MKVQNYIFSRPAFLLTFLYSSFPYNSLLMEGLAINDIPHTLLARILVQLHILPPKDTPDVMNVLAAGLRIYGKTSELNAFLDFCSTQAADKSNTPWLWTNYEINNDLDWDLANSKKPQELVGLRFLLSSETVTVTLKNILHK